MLAHTESHTATERAIVSAPNLDSHISVPAVFRLLDVSDSTGWRMIKAGNFPKITRLSARRVAVRYRHYLEYLEVRTS